MTHNTYITLEMFDMEFMVNLKIDLDREGKDYYVDHTITSIAVNDEKPFIRDTGLDILTQAQKEEVLEEVSREVARTDWLEEIEDNRINLMI